MRATRTTWAGATREGLPNLSVVGGCCGTDDRHVAAIAEAWSREAR